ncbi:hypothetical protein F5Y08DRAFT_349924 [Xylaria arbuscula]|nr:hypothetical protein F5Y08DRAFT_349924 [Xylaria arbuscula]
MANVNTSSDPRSLSAAAYERLRKSEQNQYELREHFKDTLKFSKTELSALELDTEEKFREFWNESIVAKKQFDARRNRGFRKGAKNFVNAATVAWTSITPVLEILRGAGEPFSNIAFGTVAFAFTIAANRENMERRIVATLKCIEDRRPGIQLYRNAYQENGETNSRLQQAIADAYISFIEFCIATVTFHTRTSISRWFKALGPSTSLDDTVPRVEEAILNIRLICEELLNKNVAELKIHNRDLRRDNDSYKLEYIRNVMDLPPHSDATEYGNLERAREDVKREYRDWYARLRTPNDPLASVRNNQVFLSWRTSSKHRILLLIGYNKVKQARHCWLSPIALDLITEGNPPKQEDLYVSYLLNTMASNKRFEHVACSLLFRLLSAHPHVLRDGEQYSELQAELQSYKSAIDAHSQLQTTQTLLTTIALRVLNMFDPSKTVWIIVDRIDECRNEPEDKSRQETRNLHRKTLLKFLVRLVEDESLRVKVRVLGVVNGLDWRAEEHRDEIDQMKKESIEFLPLWQARHVSV